MLGMCWRLACLLLSPYFVHVYTCFHCVLACCLVFFWLCVLEPRCSMRSLAPLPPATQWHVCQCYVLTAKWSQRKTTLTQKSLKISTVRTSSKGVIQTVYQRYAATDKRASDTCAPVSNDCSHWSEVPPRRVRIA